jgi:autotransporter translocation and assembly factor TamB
LDKTRSIDGLLTLEETEWIDAGRAVISWRGTDWNLDTLLFAMEGLELVGHGTFGADHLDLRTKLDLIDARLLRRLLGESQDPLEAVFHIQAEIAGTPARPEADVSMDGSGTFGTVRIPKLRSRAGYGAGGLRVDIEAPDGLELDRIHLDHFSLDFSSMTDTLFPARLRLQAEGEEVSLRQSCLLSLDSLVTIEVDTLALRLTNRRLENTSRFRFDFDRTSRSLLVSDLDLQGSLGTIRADGRLGADSVDLRVLLEAEAPKKPSFVGVVDALWPDHVSLDGRAIGPNRIEADVALTGLDLADRTGVGIQIGIRGDGRKIEATLDASDRSGPLATGRVLFPVSFRTFPPEITPVTGPIEAELDLLGLPIPIQEGAINFDTYDRPAQLEGKVLLKGTTNEPDINASLALSFPKWRRLSSYIMKVEADVSDTLQANLTLERESQQVLEGTLRLPLLISLQPFTTSIPEEAGLHLQARAHDLQLSDFNELLPATIALEGTARLHLGASGPVKDPSLDGNLTTQKLEISMANGTRARADLEIDIEGPASKPHVDGRIEIQNGVLRIPEEQKNLHPTSGTALLWETEGYRPTRELSEGARLPVTDVDLVAGEEAAAPPQIDLDVAVEIPSGLWIQGRGLEVELAGQLQLTQKDSALPTVAGELSASRGQLVFLGRTFMVERGGVVFYGGDEINPSLDLALTTRIKETLIRILFQGTAQKPELVLESEPEMTEGDIMAYLLFGRPIDQLDSGQMDLLEKRASDVASSYAIAQLQGRISQQLGVDMVTIRPSNADSRRSALVIGKYLSRRALVKYEQALESAADFFINLEYFLSSSFKLETFIGPQSQSGIEANWSRQF